MPTIVVQTLEEARVKLIEQQGNIDTLTNDLAASQAASAEKDQQIADLQRYNNELFQRLTIPVKDQTEDANDEKPTTVDDVVKTLNY
jgi:ribosome assembly protein YihI (activator of Der GTPase)